MDSELKKAQGSGTYPAGASERPIECMVIIENTHTSIEG